jgi:hypothetical protein
MLGGFVDNSAMEMRKDFLSNSEVVPKLVPKTSCESSLLQLSESRMRWPGLSKPEHAIA